MSTRHVLTPFHTWNGGVTTGPNPNYRFYHSHLRPDLFVSLFIFYVLATFKVISGQVPTCDSAHSW